MSLLPALFVALTLPAFAAAPLVIWPLPTPPPPGVPTATFPAPRTDWMGRFHDATTRAKARPVDLVFDGDCFLDFWDRGTVFQQRYSGYNAFDFAIDWDLTQNVLWRVQNGELDGLHPKLIVLQVGTHNNGRYSAGDFSAGITALIEAYRQHSPDSHILLLGVLHIGTNPKDPFNLKIDEVNQTISKLADGTHVTFLDLNPTFMKPDGSVSTDLLKDDATASPQGYAALADLIQPFIDQFCPKSAATAAGTPPPNVGSPTPVTPVSWPLPALPPGQPESTFPVPRADWYQRFDDNLTKLKSGPYDLVFDGDSITDNWQGPGQDVWKERYGSIKAADIAIGGDQVQHVLWRLQHGDLEGQNPKLIVLMIGTNNGGQSPKDIAAGIKLVLNEYETRCPDAHILLLGVFPRGPDAHSPTRDWVAQINQILATYDDGQRISFMDIGAKFLQPDGTLTAEIMPDFLHPSAKGYVIWADAIQPVIDHYLLKK